jgi:hypothetical protein
MIPVSWRHPNSKQTGKENTMKQLTLASLALAMTLELTGTVLAVPASSTNKGMPGRGERYGRDYAGWKSCYADKNFGCYLYCHPKSGVYYYWCGRDSCYYPVDYCPYDTYCYGGGCLVPSCPVYEPTRPPVCPHPVTKGPINTIHPIIGHPAPTPEPIIGRLPPGPIIGGHGPVITGHGPIIEPIPVTTVNQGPPTNTTIFSKPVAGTTAVASAAAAGKGNGTATANGHNSGDHRRK